MVIVTVLYPDSEQARFDFDYYFQHHIPLVKERLKDLGLEELRVIPGTASLDGGAPAFKLMGQLAFRSSGDMQEALGRHGQEIIEDIPQFTDIQPLIQMNEVLLPGSLAL